MANGKKVYQIEINGIKESIDAVDSLNRQLDSLEKRIEKLSKQNITVNTSGGGNVSALSEEDKLQQQILATEEKIKVARSESYEQLVNAKAELKEMQTIAKASAAGKNNAMGIFDDNTMLGIKEHLKSIKQEMQTMDIGSDAFKKLQNDANDLNNKLKEIEQGYGQFGRNVGNYANGVAEGMQQVVVKVGESERTFVSARDAARTLNNELKTMAINGQQGTEEYKNLNNAVKQLNSTLKDVEKSSVAMDNLLDTMQGITAIASASKGLSSLFGMDGGKIEETIQKLVALQNVLQGIEVIRKQMQTQEGIGLILSKGNKAVDSLVTAIVGVGTASKGATVATKALGVALKSIGIGVIIAGLMELIHVMEVWSDKQKKAAEEAEAAAQKIQKAIDEQRNTFVNASAQYANTASRLSHLRGEYQKTNNELKKTAILKEAAAEFKKLGLSVNGVNDAQRILVNQGDKVIEMLRLQGDAAAIAALRMEAFKRAYNILIENQYDATGASILAGYDKDVIALDKRLDSVNTKLNKVKSQLGVGNEVKSVKSDGKKVEDAVKQARDNINDLQLKLMKDGLAKELMQLDENNRKEIEKIRQNGKMVEEQLALQSKYYNQQRKEILDKFNIESEDIIGKAAIKEIRNEVDELNRIIDDKLETRPAFIQPISSYGLKEILSQWPEDEIKNLYEADEKLRKQKIAEATADYTEYYRHLTDFMKKNYMGTEEMDSFINLYQNGQDEEAFKKAEELWEKEYKEAEKFVLRYGEVFEVLQNDETQVLSHSLHARMAGEISYFEEMEAVREKYIKKRLEKEKEAVNIEMQMRNDAIVRQENEIGTQLDDLRKKRDATTGENELAKIDEEIAALEKRLKGLADEQYNVVQEYTNKLVELERNTDKFLKNLTENTFRNQVSNISDYLSEIDKLTSQQPKYNKLGFINVSATGKQYEEIKNTAVQSLRYIGAMRDEVAAKFEEGLITPEARSQIERDLNGLEVSFNTRLEDIEELTGDLPIELAKQINAYMQLFGQAATQILQSIGEIQDAAFQREMEVLDKYTEELEKQLDKQRELTEKYKDDVNNIEDELSNARGDRRQHLIDQLNAEIAAQRASYAQEKKIEREKEKNEEKKKKLEDENNKRKKKQAITTAIINAALAISNAAVNEWPIPALPMVAAATAVGAAQIAAVKAAKYADGGVLQGKSHAQGGVKVLGGRAELEGGEYITNKATTAKNVDLLDYINSKRKKIDLDDIIDFYGRKSKVGKTVRSVKAKYADGGYLPALRNDIDVSDRVVTAMESYANKPTYVQVVDIINKADNVRKVQVMAGLSGES